MTVIAMTREMGSLGRDVALRLAEDLGLDLVQHQLVEHIADKMKVREASVNRFLEGKAGMLERWGIDEKQLSLFTTEEILEVASRDNVLIRGWGATYVLRRVPHVFCVRVCASESTRAGVLMERIGLDDRHVAVKEIRANDSAHTRTMVHMFHVENWGDPSLFDATFNTDKMSVETCVRSVKDIVARPEYAVSRASQVALADMKIRARIETALKTNSITNRANPSFELTLEPGTGKVTLSGVVFDEAFTVEAEKLLRAVDGVVDVDNQLRVLSRMNIGP